MHATSLIASIALFLSIFVVIWLLATKPRPEAVAISLVGGALFLPEAVAINVPYLTLDKNTIPALIIYLALLFGKKDKTPRKTSRIFGLLLVLHMFGHAMTVILNRHAILGAPGTIIPGLNLTNIITRTFNAFLWSAVPFLVGRRVFASADNVKILLRTYSTAALIYTLFMLIELRFSPQLHNWVYGYHQHNFLQTIRAGGYRPMVFMAHGLALTLFYAMGIFSSATMHKAQVDVKPLSARMRTLLMLAVLTLCHSMGSLIYGLLFVPILFFAKPKLIARIASLGAVFILAVPLLRSMQVLPIDDVTQFFIDLNPDRGDSLAFRFKNEEIILQKWTTQPWFGFGTGRFDVYDEWGHKFVFDSAWIVTLADSGMWGFLTYFLILLSPLWMAARRIMTNLTGADRAMLSGLTVMVFVSTFDLLINGLFNNLLLLLAGCLYGYCECLAKVAAPSGPRSTLANVAASPAVSRPIEPHSF